MKNLVTFLFLSLFASNAFAFDLGGIVGDAAKKPAESINKNVNGQLDKIVKKFEGTVDGYKKELDAEIKKYKDQIKEAEATMNKIKNIRKNAEHYINIAKIILAVLSSGILVLIFVMWRIWRNIVTMKKVFKNVAAYDDIEKRLKAVEKAVALQ